MITLITTILGALTGMVPGVLQFFTQKATNAQQLELRKLELQAAREGTALQVDLAHAQSDIQQQSRIYDFASKPTGIGWVDAVTVLMRPYITAVLFHMWMAVEIALLIYGIRAGFDLEKLINLLWDESAKAMLAAVVGFWFGNRMLNRGNQQMAATIAVSRGPTVTAAKPATRPAATPASGFIPPPAGDRS